MKQFLFLEVEHTVMSGKPTTDKQIKYMHLKRFSMHSKMMWMHNAHIDK